MEEKKSKIKIANKILISVLSLILLVIIIIACFALYEPSFDKTNRITQEEVKTLIEKGSNYENYSYYNTYSDQEGIRDSDITKIKCYIKGNKILQEIQRQNAETTYNWFDLDTNAAVVTSYSNKKIAVKNNTEALKLEIELKQNKEELNSFDAFKYLGETKIKDRTQIVVKLWNKDTAYYNFLYYIDKETGLITRVEYSILGIYKRTMDKNIEYNTVTEEQVVKPDLSSFTNYEITEVTE